MSEDVPMKRCNTCPEGEQWHPATTDFFCRSKRHKDGLFSSCKVCKIRATKEWQSKNPEYNREYRREYGKEWRSKNPEYHREYKREYKSKNPEYDKEYKRRPEVKALARVRQQKYLNRPEIKERRHAYWQEYYNSPEAKERNRIHEQNRRACKRVAGGTFTQQDIQNMLKGQKGKCANASCKKKLVKYHIDHIVPLFHGGSNWPYNLQLLCPTCNLRKQDKLPHEFNEDGQMRLLL